MGSIERLIHLAIDNGLALLEVGDIKIVPGPRRAMPTEPSFIKEAEKRVGRPLTPGEKRDEILFGPGGALKVDDE